MSEPRLVSLGTTQRSYQAVACGQAARERGVRIGCANRLIQYQVNAG